MARHIEVCGGRIGEIGFKANRRVRPIVRARFCSDANRPCRVAIGIVPILVPAVRETGSQHRVRHHHSIVFRLEGDFVRPGVGGFPSCRGGDEVKGFACRIQEGDIHRAAGCVSGGRGLIVRRKEFVRSTAQSRERPIGMFFFLLLKEAVPTAFLHRQSS